MNFGVYLSGKTNLLLEYYCYKTGERRNSVIKKALEEFLHPRTENLITEQDAANFLREFNSRKREIS